MTRAWDICYASDVDPADADFRDPPDEPWCKAERIHPREVSLDYDTPAGVLDVLVGFDWTGNAAWVDAWDAEGNRVELDVYQREDVVFRASRSV